MKKALTKKWIKKLRSGKYEQSSNVLRDKEGFCCLGVLCDIVDKEGWRKDRGGEYFFDDNRTNLSVRMQEDLGIDIGTCRLLASMNDGRDNYRDNKQSFNQIADYIESKL